VHFMIKIRCLLCFVPREAEAEEAKLSYICTPGSINKSSALQ